MVPEAPLEESDSGLVPRGDGWFVLNAREARWSEGHFGAFTRFEGDVRLPQVGVSLGVLAPGQPSCMYHGDDEQEDFLVHLVSELAQGHGAGVAVGSPEPDEAYAGIPEDTLTRARDGWLPEL